MKSTTVPIEVMSLMHHSRPFVVHNMILHEISTGRKIPDVARLLSASFNIDDKAARDMIQTSTKRIERLIALPIDKKRERELLSPWQYRVLHELRQGRSVQEIARTPRTRPDVPEGVTRSWAYQCTKRIEDLLLGGDSHGTVR
jgi:hypothetical protein